jgi:NAD(P)-dependent dehydrogenase (short-subunit alcohol dehydrogenase family)
MRENLGNDVAIVTGAGRGIGQAIALSLAAEGAAVGVVARTAEEIAATAEQISEAGGRALALSVDVRDNVAVRAAASETASRLGPITLLVNNAGTPGPAGLDWEVDPEADCQPPSRRPVHPCPDPGRRLILAHLEHATGRLDPWTPRTTAPRRRTRVSHLRNRARSRR